MPARTPGDVVARGTRSSIRAYGRGAVIKVPEPATPESWIRFEAEYAEAARISGAPVPRLLGIERVAGRAASVWERVDGPSLWQHIVDAPASAAQFGALLADVHEALFELVPPVGLPPQRDRLITKIRLAATTIDPAHAAALDLIPAPSPGRLCHGDLHPSNIIMSPRGPVIVDWFDASRGDPVADIARSWLILLADGAEAPPHLPGAKRATLERLTAAYLARLGDHRDIDEDLLTRWQAVNAVARMAEGVRRDVLIGVWTRFQQQGGLHAAAN
jgi:aminoglycoside phosphotransferase (APT) family kinase protein